jgi:hypothetical protein
MNWQEWQQDADAKRKTMILGAAIVIGLLVWIFPWGLLTVKHQGAVTRTEARPMVVNPVTTAKAASPTIPSLTPPAPAPAAAVPSGADASVPGIASISGVWQGGGVVPKRNGACGLSVEIREVPGKADGSAKEGTFRASTTLVCPPFLPLWLSAHKGKQPNPAALWLQAMSTTESVLTGSLVGESLVFSHVEATASTDSQGCELESLEVRSFGNEHLLAKWREGQCEGGDVILQKVKK